MNDGPTSDGEKRYPRVALIDSRQTVTIASRRASLRIGGGAPFVRIGATSTLHAGHVYGHGHVYGVEDTICSMLWGPSSACDPYHCALSETESFLRSLRDAADGRSLLLCAEAGDVESLPLVCEYADAVRIAPRNMQNFPLLRAVGRSGRAAILQRAIGATLDEWLLAAEYIADAGGERVVLAESGIRHFDPEVPRLVDLHSVATLQQKTKLPILVDLSWCDDRMAVSAISRAAMAIGADGAVVPFDGLSG